MIVEVSGLTKIYEGKQRVVAVDGIDLSVDQGEIFGLLGPNGAGKTTTISICTTRALPTAGQVRIAGIDVVAHPALARRDHRRRAAIQHPRPRLTVFENLYFHCRYFGFKQRRRQSPRRPAAQAVPALGTRQSLSAISSPAASQQRVQIARAIAHRPAVLFLDEPSAGLDPQSRIAMWEAVEGLRGQGITVVLTTHYMEEADELCDRVAIVDHGKILALDTPGAPQGDRRRQYPSST